MREAGTAAVEALTQHREVGDRLQVIEVGRPVTPLRQEPPHHAQVPLVRGEQLAWGPKCAVMAGVVKPKRRPTKPPTPGRARAFAGQLDWIETTEEGQDA